MTRVKTPRKAVNKPPTHKIEDKAQYERFREFARKNKTDENRETFDRKSREIVAPKK